jgi:hypothetical protein
MEWWLSHNAGNRKILVGWLGWPPRYLIDEMTVTVLKRRNQVCNTDFTEILLGGSRMVGFIANLPHFTGGKLSVRNQNHLQRRQGSVNGWIEH